MFSGAVTMPDWADVVSLFTVSVVAVLSVVELVEVAASPHENNN